MENVINVHNFFVLDGDDVASESVACRFRAPSNRVVDICIDHQITATKAAESFAAVVVGPSKIINRRNAKSTVVVIRQQMPPRQSRMRAPDDLL